MKTLVTGGCGFIGSHLAEILLALGHEVVILDNLACGRKENIKTFETHSKLSFHQIDICDRTAMRPHLQGVDWVFHMAGLADIVPSIEQPDGYFQANVVGTLNVLQCARDAGEKICLCRIIFLLWNPFLRALSYHGTRTY